MAEFYKLGGWGMYPVTLFGFFFFATAVLSVLRPGRLAWHPLLVCLGSLTLGAGLLGTCVGVISTAAYLSSVPAADQVVTAMAGIGESVHVLVLSLLIFLPSVLVVTAGVLRAPKPAAGV